MLERAKEFSKRRSDSRLSPGKGKQPRPPDADVSAAPASAQPSSTMTQFFANVQKGVICSAKSVGTLANNLSPRKRKEALNPRPDQDTYKEKLIGAQSDLANAHVHLTAHGYVWDRNHQNQSKHLPASCSVCSRTNSSVPCITAAWAQMMAKMAVASASQDDQTDLQELEDAVRIHLSKFLSLNTKERGMLVYGMLKDDYR